MKYDEHENRLRHISPESLAALGGPGLAYIRQVPVPGGIGWGIFSGQSGQAMGVIDGREAAFATARQHDLEPVDVH